MKIHALLLFFCCTYCSVHAQQPTGLVFPIAAAEHYYLLTTEDPSIDFLEKRTPVSTYEKSSRQLDSLPPGHYLIVETDKEKIHWFTRSSHHHQLFVHENEKRLQVSIADSLGQAIEDAVLELDQDPISFDAVAGYYQSKHTKSGLLVAYLPNDTLLYQLGTWYDRPLFWRRYGYFSGSRVGYVITTPVRLTSKVYHFFRNGIGHGDWRPNYWPFERLINRIRYPEERYFRGYIATQQPVYRKGDTIQISAYLAKQKGKPYRKEVNLKILANYRTIHSAKLSSLSAGQYTYDWVVGDSLPIDQTYKIEIEERSWRNPRSISHRLQIGRAHV